MQNDSPLMVQCGDHGERIATVVCAHLLRSADGPAGFVENSTDPEDLQAWCDRCEEVFVEEDGLTEVFRRFNDMRLVCDRCYAALKARHGGGPRAHG